MNEHPILFTGDMVRAILNGQKTMTRRPIKPQPEDTPFGDITCINGQWYQYRQTAVDDYTLDKIKSPFGNVGDILWVRERARLIDCIGFMCKFRYEADGTETRWIAYPERLKPLEVGRCVPNGCFRELARIFLMNDEIRVERVQDISNEDAMAEGLKEFKEVASNGTTLLYGVSSSQKELGLTPKDGFEILFESIYGEEFLKSNPYVFADKFHRVEAIP